MKRSRPPVLTIALLMLVSTALLPSSNRAAAAVHSNARAHPGLGIVQEALPAQAPLFRSAVTRVRVDAIVTDDDSNFVDNLTRQDFQIFEDGVEQRILNIQLVDLETGETVDVESESAAHESASSNGGGNGAYDAGPELTPIARTPGTLGAIVYLVDLPSLDPKNKPGLTATFTDFIEGSETLHVPRSVFMIDQHGEVQGARPPDHRSRRATRGGREVVCGCPDTQDYLHAPDDGLRARNAAGDRGSELRHLRRRFHSGDTAPTKCKTARDRREPGRTGAARR